MKKILIALLVAGALIGATYGAAAAIVVGGVDQLGSNDAAVSPTGTTTDIAWTLDTADITLVTGAVVKLTTATAAGDTVCIQVSDSSGPTILANGCVDPGAVAVGTGITVPFDAAPSLTADAELIDTVDVTITNWFYRLKSVV